MTEAEELSRLIEGARYQLKLLPSKSLTLWLLFTARKEATYNFELPISLLGYGFSVAGGHGALLILLFWHLSGSWRLPFRRRFCSQPQPVFCGMPCYCQCCGATQVVETLTSLTATRAPLELALRLLAGRQDLVLQCYALRRPPKLFTMCRCLCCE